MYLQVIDSPWIYTNFCLSRPHNDSLIVQLVIIEIQKQIPSVLEDRLVASFMIIR